MQLNYRSIAELVQQAESRKSTLSALVLTQQATQLEQTEQAVFAKMEAQFLVMEQAVAQGNDPDLRSASGLTGGDAGRMFQAVARGKTLCGGTFAGALARALAVSELNAAMGRIVAAPTAGSCGILPAALLTAQEAHGVTREACVMALFTASAFGMVIAKNASLAGAEGGCQAECGAAGAMAAAALVELMGGSPQQSADAAAITLKNMMGLVCDPVAGLVEIPCIKRNVAGIANALAAAELALAGIGSKIPVDEVILAMKRVGDAMPAALRETAEGGLAATPTARRLAEQVFGAPDENASEDCAGCRVCRP